MRRNLDRCLFLVLLVLAAGCGAGGQASGSSPGARRDILTQEQIAATNETNVYAVVETLRSNWLRERGSDTLIREPTRVQVYLDGTRLGEVETLRAISAASVSYIQHFDGIAASARWGLGHGQGVIYVATQPTRQP